MILGNRQLSVLSTLKLGEKTLEEISDFCKIEKHHIRVILMEYLDAQLVVKKINKYSLRSVATKIYTYNDEPNYWQPIKLSNTI